MVSPLEIDLVSYVKENRTDWLMWYLNCWCKPALDTMTEIAGIKEELLWLPFTEKPVDLFKFFWKELKLIGARVYEKEDYEKQSLLLLPMNCLLKI